MELTTSILGGLAVGILGSFHCIGMCGPLALALPVHKMSELNKKLSIGLYNLGRMLTYTIIGILLGWFGSQFELWGLQKALSIGAGILVILFLILRYTSIRLPLKVPAFQNKINQQIGKWLQSPTSIQNYLWIGVANGLLPCGLVYVAVAGSLASGSIMSGAVFMAGFGFGTIPVMATLMVFGQWISLPVRQRMNRAIPYLIGCMAVILLLRGMNLGIPYLSPQKDERTTEVSCCHSYRNLPTCTE